MSVPILSIENLSVAFNTRRGVVNALKNVSLSIEKGEIHGIVGESGSGKSVTAYTFMGLLDRAGKVTGGTAAFDGMSLLDADLKTLTDLRGREFSMVFQNPRAALNPIRPVGKQIEDVLLRHAQVTRQDAKTRAIDMLKTVRIIDPERRYWAYPFELSGGMCQRVVIAIALACAPRLLIADEPTTGLDVTTQKSIMDLIRDLTWERHMSVALITHDLGLAAEYCRKITVMRHGEVVEAAPVTRLFADPRHPYTRRLISASPGPASRLQNLTHNPPAARAATQPVADDQALLAVRNLVKAYPRKAETRLWPFRRGHESSLPFRAVDDISFDIGYGESVGLVGESGCGKSTTSSIIARLLDPNSGQVIFKGREITSIEARAFPRRPERRKIQMVFQDATDSLNPRYTARTAIAEPIRQLAGLSGQQEINRRVERLAEMVGLPVHLLDRLPHQLSGGQKARVGIARAIAAQPELLVLDEPTSALDVSVQAVVLQLLDRLKHELGMSYLFVSHDLNVVQLLCDRVIVMNRGRIVETGPTDQVLQDPAEDYTKSLISAIPHFRPASTANKANLPTTEQVPGA